MHVVGGPSVDHRMTLAQQRDVTVLMTLSILVAIVVLFVLFRRPSAVILPVLVVLSAMSVKRAEEATSVLVETRCAGGSRTHPPESHPSSPESIAPVPLRE
jgi:hypothetical protein